MIQENFQLTREQIASLKALHRTLRDRKKADRVKAVVLLGTGWTEQEVAEALLVDQKTICHWYEKYHTGGEKELLAMMYQGKSPLLNESQQTELARHLDENTYLTSKEIRHYIEKTYKVKYSSTGVKELLYRLNFVYKKPKHEPGKLDPEKQAAFVAEYEKLKEIKGENDPVYFMDASHPQFNSIPAYGWIRRGVEKELKSNGGRKRVNINGAVNIESLRICVDFSKTINDRSTLRLCRKLETGHPDAGEIHVVLDNATYYKSKWLKEQLKGTKVRFHYLPGYSPNLNVIERLWKFFKKKILYNQYHEKFEDFLAACKSFFQCRTKYREELRSLLTDNFHLYSTN